MTEHDRLLILDRLAGAVGQIYSVCADLIHPRDGRLETARLYLDQVEGLLSKAAAAGGTPDRTLGLTREDVALLREPWLEHPDDRAEARKRFCDLADRIEALLLLEPMPDRHGAGE